MLSTDEIAAHQENGLIIPRDFRLAPTAVDRLRDAVDRVVDDPKFDGSTARYVKMRPGQASLHDVHLPHGSAATVSGRRRAGLAIRYMPATSVFRRDMDLSGTSRQDWTTIPISLMRGENRAWENDLRVGRQRPR